MPKKVKFHPNERLDLPDLKKVGGDYAQEQQAYYINRAFIDRFSRVINGFRIQIADQASNPGQLTITNGNAFDRDGYLLNNESQVNDSRTVTLTGASTTFYVEIEFTEANSDVDSRAFWDPTVTNTSPIPDGQDFDINVTTRVTPDWQIVSPVSTTGFDISSNPSSTKLPIAKLTTNGSNEIDTSGITLINFASTLEELANTGDTTVKLFDSSFIFTGDTIDIDVGSGATESVTVTNNDRANGIVTFSPSLVGTHNTGAIVQVTGVTGRYVKDRTTAEPITSDADQRYLMFVGNVDRGYGLISSKDTFGARDTTQISSVKDYVDSQSALVNELKWGNRGGSTDKLPPTSFSSTEYYDFAGSVTGARANTVSVGDGTNSYGDLNLTEPLFGIGSALNLFSTSANEGGLVYYKRGNYTATTASDIAINDYVAFVGEGPNSVTWDLSGISENITIDQGSYDQEQYVLFKNIRFVGNSSTNGIKLTQGKVIFENCVFEDAILDVDAGILADIEIQAINTIFNRVVHSGGNHNINNSYFENCVFSNTSTNSTYDLGTGNFVLELAFSSCVFEGFDDRAFVGTNPAGEYLLFKDCVFSGGTNAQHGIFLQSQMSTSSIIIRNCIFETIQGPASPAAIYLDYSTTSGSHRHLVISQCEFKDIGTSGVNDVYGIYINDLNDTSGPDESYSGVISNNHIRTVEGAINVYGIYVNNSERVFISDNHINELSGNSSVFGVYLTSSSSCSVQGNKIMSIIGSATDAFTAGINFAGDRHQITNNVVDRVSSGTASASNESASIVSEDLQDHCFISSNILSMYATNSTINYGINCKVSSVNQTGCTISLNDINAVNFNATKANFSGIKVNYAAATDEIYNLSVVNNRIQHMPTGGKGINLLLGEGSRLINVSGNTIEEEGIGSYDASVGIEIVGISGSRAEHVSVSNNTVVVPVASITGAANRYGIYTNYCDNVRIQNNTAHWNPGATTGSAASIFVNNGDRVLISANLVSPADTIADEIEYGTGSDFSFIGNIVGDSSLAGGINNGALSDGILDSNLNKTQ